MLFSFFFLRMFNVIRLSRLNLSGVCLLKCGMQMNQDIKGYLKNISAITQALRSSLLRLAEKDVCFITAAALSLPLSLSVQLKHFSSASLSVSVCLCVYRLEGKHERMYVGVSRAMCVCVWPCLLHN